MSDEKVKQEVIPKPQSSEGLTENEEKSEALNQKSSRWLIYIVILLLLSKFIIPLIFTIFIVLSTLLAVTLAGIYFVSSSKSEINLLRSRFPRMKFTKQEEWLIQTKELQKKETFSFIDGNSQFIQTFDPIITLVLRDFVMTWFSSISQSNAFPNEIRQELRLVIGSLESRAHAIEIDQLIVLRLVPILIRHFNNFVAAEESVIGDHSLSGSTDLDIRIAKEYDNIGRLHRAISLTTIDQEKTKKLYARDKVSKILPYLLSCDESSSSVVSTLVREILSNIVLFPTIRLLSDSDFWNQMIIKIASSTLKDRDQVRELRNVIDKQYHAPPKSKGKLTINDRITPQMKQPEFEKYIKGIDISTSLPLLKQLKYYVAVQISRTQRVQSKSDKFLKYRKRLNVAKVRIDTRITQLANENPDIINSENRNSLFLSKPDLDEFIIKLSLNQILSNPSSLSIFTEYMEQRSRTDLLQFWLTVNGIKDPLEDPLSPGYEEELSSSTDIGGTEDIKLIFNQFFKKKLLRVDPETFKKVGDFVSGVDRSLESYLRARKLILLLQTEVFKRMQERDLPDFKNSDLILKLLANESFEESLVREVNVFGEDHIEEQDRYQNKNGDSYDEDETNTRNDTSLTEIENALTNILKKEPTDMNELHTIQSSHSMNSSKTPNTEKLKSEIFGNDDQGFLDEKPLFDDEKNDINETDAFIDEEDDKFNTDPEFFSTTYDALNLKEDIEDLEEDIETLTKQSSLLDPLILKAELTSNNSELRLLRKSKVSYQREIESKELQRQQLIVQDNENSLFGKTKIEINTWVKSTSGNRDFIVYIVEIRKSSTKEGQESSTWVVGRRFSQFYKLNEILQRDIPEISSIPFPKKKIVLKFQQKSLIDERRSQLQDYLRRLLEISQVCQHKEFRKFLTVEDYNASPEYNSPSMSSSRFEIKDAANKLYNGLYSGIDMLSSRSPSNENLTKIDNESSEDVEDMRKELEVFENEEDRMENKSFVKPITDLFIALFPLNTPNSWLRGRAIIVVLQQVFGSTIEKHIKGQIANLTAGDKIGEIISLLQGILWPNGKFMESGEPRSSKEKIKSKQDSKILLESLLVDTCSKIVGQSSSRVASYRLHSMLQNEILNTNVIYEILDALIEGFFPELNDINDI